MGPASRLPVLRSWSFEASVAARTALKRRLADGRPDAVFIHTQVAALLAVRMMGSVPTVISMDATPMNFDSLAESYDHRRQIPPLESAKRQVNRRAFLASRAIVTWSQWAADSVVNDYHIPEDRVHIIRPGVDLRRFRPAGPRPEGWRPEGPTRILFVGGDFARKGGGDLLEAMEQIDGSAELDIVTSSPPAALPPGLQVRVHVGLGHDSQELFDLYRKADIFALPSRGECYGLVFSEALASGLPVVACDVGAVREMVVDGHNGLLVPPRAPAQLAEALRTLIARPDLRRSMAEQGLALARREHDADRNAGAIFDLMRKLCI
jgi:glycosyltransferase involved in cell wall biosynthesis